MLKAGMALALVIVCSPAAAQPGGPLSPAAPPILAEPGTTTAPLGSSTIVRPPQGPPATVSPFGSGTIIKREGAPPVVCDAFGSGVWCR